jgi:hypothetical protein
MKFVGPIMLSNDEIGGKIIGWGTGQTQSAVDKTEAVTKNLTHAKLEEMIQKGLTKDWVKKQFSMYEAALKNPAKAKNINLKPRFDLMKKILSLWPG